MITLSIDRSGVDEKSLQVYQDRIAPELEVMKRVIQDGGYEDERASLTLPDDVAMLERVKQAAAKFGTPDTIVLIGMGGPGMGSKAVQEALTGTLHNYLCTPRVFYADTIDGARIAALLQVIETDLAQKKRVVIVVNTQSGTTTESIANMERFLELLERHGLDPARHMPVVTNEGSKLDGFAEQLGLERVVVPPIIGGRYSVLSPVGLFPLALLGIDIEQLVAGARQMRDQCLGSDLTTNPAAQSAAVVHHHSQIGKNVHVTFLFAPELESVGLWCRQIMAESLGKEKTRQGKMVHTGMTPTVAIGSRELHSTFQLYMEGPNDKFTTFVRVGVTDEVVVPKKPEFEVLTQNLQGKTFQQISDAILEGVLAAYDDHHRPYSVLTLPDTQVQSVGQLLQWKMMETMFLGALLEINPFDQPGVESYKAVTKQILAS